MTELAPPGPVSLPTDTAERTRIEDISQALTLRGTHKIGHSFSVSRDDLKLFERSTWIDRVYLEPDPPDFPADIVEGFHLLGLLDATARAAYDFETSRIWTLNYGIDAARFVSPIYLQDPVVPIFDVLDVCAKGQGFRLLRRCTFQVPGNPRPGMVADWSVLLLPRAGEAS